MADVVQDVVEEEDDGGDELGRDPHRGQEKNGAESNVDISFEEVIQMRNEIRIRF